MKSVPSIVCAAAFVLFGICASALACTNLIVTKGASADGSVMITYTCDGEFHPRLRVEPAADHGPDEWIEIKDWSGVVKGRISLERMVDVLSTGTARMFGLAGKGAVAPGKDADIVVFDPKRKFTITQKKLHMKVDYTPWEGVEVTGMPQIVYSRGKRVAEWAGDQMKFVGEAGRGRFVKREPLAAF